MTATDRAETNAAFYYRLALDAIERRCAVELAHVGLGGERVLVQRRANVRNQRHTERLIAAELYAETVAEMLETGDDMVSDGLDRRWTALTNPDLDLDPLTQDNSPHCIPEQRAKRRDGTSLSGRAPFNGAVPDCGGTHV